MDNNSNDDHDDNATTDSYQALADRGQREVPTVRNLLEELS